jgi:hypothetical protein
MREFNVVTNQMYKKNTKATSRQWFKANKYSINFNKTHYIQFTSSNNNLLTEIKVAYDRQQITSLSNIKFLGIYIDDKMSWKHHIEQISSTLKVTCYTIRTTKPYTSINTLKMVYYSYFACIINYGLPFWGNSPQCINIFRIQQNVTRIMLDCRRRDSCKKLFRNVEILPLASQYIFSLKLFLIKK